MASCLDILFEKRGGPLSKVLLYILLWPWAMEILQLWFHKTSPFMSYLFLNIIISFS